MCIRDRRPTITRTPATRRLRWLHSETLRPISVQVQAQIVPQRSRNFGLAPLSAGSGPVSRLGCKQVNYAVCAEFADETLDSEATTALFVMSILLTMPAARHARSAWSVSSSI